MLRRIKILFFGFCFPEKKFPGRILLNFAAIMQSIRIHKSKIHSIERRHPWIFSGAITSDTSQISEGETVRVEDPKGRFLAMGHFQPATISVRILSFEERDADQDFFNEQLKKAVDLRMKLNLLFLCPRKNPSSIRRHPALA